VVTNIGNVTVHDIRVDETAFSGTGRLSAIHCPVTKLAPGKHTTCTATYTVTRADVAAGKVTDTAVARGKLPTGQAVTSRPSTATVTIRILVITTGVPGGASGPSTVEIGLGAGLILIAATTVTGLIGRRRRGTDRGDEPASL
jgi:hypothetical protein